MFVTFHLEIIILFTGMSLDVDCSISNFNLFTLHRSSSLLVHLPGAFYILNIQCMVDRSSDSRLESRGNRMTLLISRPNAPHSNTS